jgi:hypothetical protein
MKAPPAKWSVIACLNSCGHTLYARSARCTILAFFVPVSLLFLMVEITIAGKVLAHSSFNGLSERQGDMAKARTKCRLRSKGSLNGEGEDAADRPPMMLAQIPVSPVLLYIHSLPMSAEMQRTS